MFHETALWRRRRWDWWQFLSVCTPLRPGKAGQMFSNRATEVAFQCFCNNFPFILSISIFIKIGRIPKAFYSESILYSINFVSKGWTSGLIIVRSVCLYESHFHICRPESEIKIKYFFYINSRPPLVLMNLPVCVKPFHNVCGPTLSLLS